MKLIEGYTVSYRSKKHGWISPKFFRTRAAAEQEQQQYELQGYETRILKDISYGITRLR